MLKRGVCVRLCSSTWLAPRSDLNHAAIPACVLGLSRDRDASCTSFTHSSHTEGMRHAGEGSSPSLRARTCGWLTDERLGGGVGPARAAGACACWVEGGAGGTGQDSRSGMSALRDSRRGPLSSSPGRAGRDSRLDQVPQTARAGWRAPRGSSHSLRPWCSCERTQRRRRSRTSAWPLHSSCSAPFLVSSEAQLQALLSQVDCTDDVIEGSAAR